MLALTKIKRSYIIDHVSPSDLDKRDIKHGLLLKEQMIDSITDDYIKKNHPDWKKMEREFRKRGLTEYIDRIMCGEMTYDEVPKQEICQMEVWMRYKPFKTGTFIPSKRKDEYQRYESYDFDRLDGYCDWIKAEDDRFKLKDKKDLMVQFQIAIIGKNCFRYYPFQDSSHYNGFEYVDDNVKIYDPQVWDRNEEDGSLIKSISELTKNDEYYRFIFKNYKGYYNFQFEEEYDEWIQKEYPDQKVRTLQTDPFRILYVNDDKPIPGSEGTYGVDCVISAKQYIKTNYITEMVNICDFTFELDNLHVV